MKLSDMVARYESTLIRKDLIMEFGDGHDGAIEFAGLVQGGII